MAFLTSFPCVVEARHRESGMEYEFVRIDYAMKRGDHSLFIRAGEDGIMAMLDKDFNSKYEVIKVHERKE